LNKNKPAGIYRKNSFKRGVGKMYKKYQMIKNSLTQTKIFLFNIIIILFMACKEEKVEPVVVVPPPPPVVVKSAAKDIKTFTIDEVSINGIIDATAKTITITLPEIVNPSEVKPTLTIADKASSSPASGVVQDFTKEVSYTITAEDGTTQIYKVVLIVTKNCKLKELRTNNISSYAIDYDARGRIIQETNLDEKLLPTFIKKYTYDNKNYCKERVNEAKPGNGTSSKTVYEYANNKLTKETQTYADGKIEITSYEYDASGNLTKLNRNGFVISFNGGKATSITNLDIIYTLNAAGLIANIKYKSGDIVSYLFDSNNQLIEFYNNDSKGIATSKFTYLYNTKKVFIEPQASYDLGKPIIPNFNGAEVFHFDKINGSYLESANKEVKFTTSYSQDLDAKGRLISETVTEAFPGRAPTVLKYSFLRIDCD
jgi:Domain of unknown function (DUF5018)